MKQCKICNKNIENIKRIYCSNKCKFSDKDYNLSRISKSKNNGYKQLKCNLCCWSTMDYENKSGIITTHLKSHHIEFDRKNYLQYFNILEINKKDYWYCPYCSWKTLDYNNRSGCIINHLEKIHRLNILNIIESDLLKNIHSKKIEKLIKNKFLMENEKNRIKCQMCGGFFKKLSNSHLRKHNISPSEYKIKYDIINTASDNTSEIQSECTYKHNFKFGSFNRKRSSLEENFIEKLKICKLEYISPFLYNGKKYDIFIPIINSVVEIDGEIYHKDNLKNLTLQTLNGSINDFKKNKIMQLTNFNFYRIRYNCDVDTFSNVNELQLLLRKNNYIPDYSIEYNQKVITKEYLEKSHKFLGKEKLKKYSYLFLKFLHTFHPEFPHPPLKENLVDVINKIQRSDLNKVYYKGNPKEFSNNISTIGHNYLKHYFKSYWKSKFNGNPSPVEAWNNDEILLDVIKYRIGCNNSNEIFDFSLHQVIRGLSARRITISFFKPLLAAAIYKHYLKDNPTPIVLDPCCGFGGRLLGFKSIYPNGRYVGCEPNTETFNELTRLVENAGWYNVELYNCKFEDFIPHKYDLIFTSIPYYDLEIYSNNTEYSSFEEWRDSFIKSIERCNQYGNCLINAPTNLAEKLNWNNIDSYIVSNTTHFNKTDDQKREVIVKL